ncbi:hypothetical protein MYCTH_2308278 [Thermothelomyces thermophilus ATCC 42464]|uniref:Uncharacterized protein n=1 Tax=Thermothelomyces thermophilus (strain ATCC 42464 / BCRC 31852 / DSM 1799) TaxID=573729 RepID=G2QJK0_THET4|nr:uncharacterized protein MYCTH_2308278 [Thermothelomyces thermophilus ATCC 42464]AEO59757.1 hypothetical protein MYCTH_2308278 [Thermothelomyces thermophilus ATCC 42464]
MTNIYNTNLGYGAVLAVACVITAIILLCPILDIVCIVKRARRTLSPPFFLGVNITQGLFYIVNFALTMAGPRKGAVVIVISVFILLSFLGLLFYASVVYHQYRTGSLAGTYIPTVNPEMHNLVASNTSYPRIADPPAPLQFAYAQKEYPKSTATYYDLESVGRVRQFGPPGYAPANAACEPFRPADSKTDEPGQQLENRVHPRSAV